MESVLPTRGLASTKARLVIDCVDGDAEAIYTCVAQSINEKIVSSTYVHIESKWNCGESITNNAINFIEFFWEMKMKLLTMKQRAR